LFVLPKYITYPLIHIGSPMFCDVIWFLSDELFVFHRKHKNHITSQSMGDSFYHIFTTPYLFLLTLFFGGHGIGIHNLISKNYHMSGISLISRKNCISWISIFRKHPCTKIMILQICHILIKIVTYWLQNFEI
jgi:hypothetical protein